MIEIRGNVDCHDDDKRVHLKMPAGAGGRSSPWPRCSYGSYHLRWSSEVEEVDCVECLHRYYGEFPSTNPALAASGVRNSFLHSEEASEVAEADQPTVEAYYEHGQWWIGVRATGAQWAVHDQVENGRQTFCFERISDGETR